MNFSIEETSHYIVLAGSHSYGTATDSSDVDIRGWCIPPISHALSYFKKFEQYDKSFTLENFPWKQLLINKIPRKTVRRMKTTQEKIDSCIYDLSKFTKLAADANPNIVDLFFTDEEDIVYIDAAGRELLKNKYLFLSAKAKFTYSGYAHAQLKRLETHRKWLQNPPTHKPTREEYNLTEFTTIPADQRQAAERLIEKKVRLWLLEEAEIDKSLVRTIQNDLIDAVQSLGVEASKEEFRSAAAKRLGFSDNFIETLQAEKKYKVAKTTWDQYTHWKKTRNPQRAELERKFGFDAKHASHLVRLLDSAKEILTKGNLTLKDKNRAELMSEVRNGHWSYEQLIEYAKQNEEGLDKIYKEKKYCVPKSPDVHKIDKLFHRVLEIAWGKKLFS